MKNNYFTSYNNYFWQWEEWNEVIAIPNDSTLIYKEQLLNIIQSLAPFGLPPLGSLLMVHAALNQRGRERIDSIYAIISTKTKNKEEEFKAFSFLRLLFDIPEEYKKGEKLVYLLKSIFEGCHYHLSIKSSKIVAEFSDESTFTMSKPIEVSQELITKELRVLSILYTKLPSVKEILAKITSLPQVEEIDEEQLQTENTSDDFIETVIENEKLYPIGMMAKYLTAGFHIPFYQSLPSSQPLGGVADITNKGEFDKLLITEFANEDTVFLSKIANNEALYFHREVPPTNNLNKRVFLIDISLKNWGSIKTLSFASMIAIAKHKKANNESQVFLVGDKCKLVDANTLDGIIEAIQRVEACMDATEGYRAFFENHYHAHDELFLLGSKASHELPSLQKIIYEHQAKVNFWIQSEADGEINLYKNQNARKKHVQRLIVPLAKMYERKKNKETTNKPSYDDFPLLCPNPVGFKELLYLNDGTVFKISQEKTLLRNRYENISTKKNNKGWKVVSYSVPYKEKGNAITYNDKGELFYIWKQKYDIKSFNLETSEKTVVKNTLINLGLRSDFTIYSINNTFYGIDDMGHIVNINISGVESTEELTEKEILHEREIYDTKLQEIKENKTYPDQILKNIKSIYINTEENLVFNNHRLFINHNHDIKLKQYSGVKKLVKAEKMSKDNYAFADGSQIIVYEQGIIKLVSSKKNIEDIYIASCLNRTLGVATQNKFAGNEYFYDDMNVQLKFIRPNASQLVCVKLIKTYLGIGLKEAKYKVDHAPFHVEHIESKKVTTLYQELIDAGATVEIKRKKAPIVIEKNKDKFYTEHIHAFIKNIIENAA